MKKYVSLLLFLPSLVIAQAQVFPTRLTLTEEAPSSYLNLRNSSGKTQRFEIELMQFRMSKEGNLTAAKESSSILNDGIKFSPKNVDVAPGEKQIIRVMNTAFDTLADGEYFIHLRFLPALEAPAVEKGKSGFNLQARIAVAVPIVVRKGAAKFDGKLNNLKAVYAKDGNISVSFDLTNTTKYFITGDLEVFAGLEKAETEISKTVGLSSYLPARIVKINISAKELAEQKLQAADLKKIRIRLASNPDSGTAFELVSDTELKPVTTEPKSNKKISKPRSR